MFALQMIHGHSPLCRIEVDNFLKKSSTTFCFFDNPIAILVQDGLALNLLAEQSKNGLFSIQIVATCCFGETFYKVL